MATNEDIGGNVLSGYRFGTVLRFGVEEICKAKRIALAVLLLSAACGDVDRGTGPVDADNPNQAPRAVDDIADLDLIQGERDAVLDVSGYFRDGDGDALSFSAVSSDKSVAVVAMSGSTLIVKSISPGETTIKVTATDPAGLSATRRFRVYVESLDPNLTGPYESLDWISVTPGRIVWRPVSSLPLSCLGWTEATVNDVTYRIHFSHWQKRDGPTGFWTDIPGTRRVRRMCGYTPFASGEYRLVMELSIDGVRGRYASTNTITALCDRGDCRFSGFSASSLHRDRIMPSIPIPPRWWMQ